MRAETPGITNVFQRSYILRIPFFQRQYVWGQKEWDSVMDNLVKRLENMLPWVHLENQRKMLENTLELQKGTPLGIFQI